MTGNKGNELSEMEKEIVTIVIIMGKMEEHEVVNEEDGGKSSQCKYTQNTDAQNEHIVTAPPFTSQLALANTRPQIPISETERNDSNNSNNNLRMTDLSLNALAATTPDYLIIYSTRFNYRKFM